MSALKLRQPALFGEVWLHRFFPASEACFPREQPTFIRPNQVEAGELVTAIKPTRPPKMLSVMTLRDREEIRVRIAEKTGSSHTDREWPPLFHVAKRIPQNVVGDIVFQTEKDQLRFPVPEPEASGIREAGQVAFGIENMCVKPLVRFDLLKETTVLVIEFSIRKGNCCLHFRIIREPPMSAMGRKRTVG